MVLLVVLWNELVLLLKVSVLLLKELVLLKELLLSPARNCNISPRLLPFGKFVEQVEDLQDLEGLEGSEDSEDGFLSTAVPTYSVLGAEEKRGQHYLSFLFGEHLAQPACPERLICRAEFYTLRILDRKNIFFLSQR